MTDDKIPPIENDREQAKPERAGQQVQRSQTTVAARPTERPAPGRRPLFRS